MSQIKIYIRTNGNIKEQAQAYAQVFKGQILKKSFLNIADINNNKKNDKNHEIYNFAYLKLVDNLKILIAKHKKDMPTYGFQSDIVISLDNADDFIEIFENLKNNKNFTHDYGPMKYEFGGGVTLLKFYDKWGYGWILETKSGR